MRLLSALLILSLISCKNTPPVPDYASYDDYPVYPGDDLGMTYSPDATTFKLYSPAAEEARVHLYRKDVDEETPETLELERMTEGVWRRVVDADLEGRYYTYQVKQDGVWLPEAPDPYAVAAGTNGLRAQVIDLGKTDPEGWMQDERPPLAHPTDMVIYELHVRDLSVAPNSGIRNKGKFLGLTETGTLSPEGLATGLDHLKEMGITHVHLLPSFDFLSIDETKPPAVRGFNWGYDPHLYNVPEGSYATDPADGAVRVREFKQMVKTLHENGLRVIMDVVYNHTGASEESVFNRVCPGYYYRHNADGTLSNASACGNETASEREMVRKFITNSVRYWATEYHVDGFRFDLMGIHDLETMNAVTATLTAVDPTIFVYGEGWTAGDSPLPVEKRALKAHVPELTAVAAFSDDVRDAIKGHVFTHDAKGFISGLKHIEETIKFGTVAATQHPQINYDSINYSGAAWAPRPGQCITYASCHDNHTIWDRLEISTPEASESDRQRMQELALGIVLTSQGVSFLHAGSEFCRTKGGEENSYKSPDAVNQLDWSRKSEFRETVEFVKNLIQLRREHPAFRMQTTSQIAEHLRFLDTPRQMVAYQLDGTGVEDDWKKIVVAYNGKKEGQPLDLPGGRWTVVAEGNRVNADGLGRVRDGRYRVPASSMVILKRD